MRQLVCTEERIARVEELVNQRMTNEDIAKELGVSMRSVGRMLATLKKRGDVKYRRRGCRGIQIGDDKKMVEVVRELSSKGISQRDIAERLSVTKGTIWNIMRKYGIEKGEEMGGSGRKDSVKDLYESGLSPDAISAKLGISINGVYAVLDALPKEPVVSQESNVIEKPIVEETLEEVMERLRKSEEEKETVERVDTEKAEDTEETESEESSVENPCVTLGKVLCGLFKAHGTILTSWGNNTNIPNDCMDMFVVSERLTAVEKEVFGIGRMVAEKWVNKDE